MSAINSAGHIVVGTDGSKRADKAVAWAAERATQRNLPILIVMAIAATPIPSRTGAASVLQVGPEFQAAVREHAQTRLAEMKQRYSDLYPHLTIDTAVAEGSPAQVLVDAASDADLVVVGARGKSAPATLKLLGGVADTVAAHAPGAIAVIPEEAELRSDAPIVVGVDDSKEARLAIRRAFNAASVRKVPLIALTAWDYGPYDAYNADVWEHTVAEMNDEITKEVEKILAEERENYPDVSVEIKVVRGRASAALVKESRSAGMIVMGSRGRGGFTGLLLGSTSKRVLRDAQCPVMVTRGEAGWHPQSN